MTIKKYNKKREKKRLHFFRRNKRKNKRIKFYSTLREKKIEKELEDKKLYKLSIRITQEKKKRKNIKITRRSRKVSKIKKYFANILLRKYRRKKNYKIKRKSSTRVEKYIKNIFNYPDRKIQPTWVLRKIAYIISYIKMYNNIYKKKKILKYDKKTFMLFGKNNIPKKNSFKNKKTFMYNNSTYNFMIKKKELTIAKSYKKSSTKPYAILKTIKNALWNIICIFKVKNKRKRRKSRHLRFKLRMLNKYFYFNKNRYRRKKIYKKINKIFKKKVKIKLKNNKTKKILLKTYKKNYRKVYKIKTLRKILKKTKKQNHKNLRLIQNFLHYIKRETLTVNTIIKRKQKRKFFWLTSLYFTKNDIKDAFCLRMLHKPLALQKFLVLQKN